MASSNFSAAVSAWVEKTKRRMEDVVHTSSRLLAEAVVEGTPDDGGALAQSVPGFGFGDTGLAGRGVARSCICRRLRLRCWAGQSGDPRRAARRHDLYGLYRTLCGRRRIRHRMARRAPAWCGLPRSAGPTSSSRPCARRRKAQLLQLTIRQDTWRRERTHSFWLRCWIIWRRWPSAPPLPVAQPGIAFPSFGRR